MSVISTEALLTQLNWRYAVKKFDPAKKISPSDWKTLEEALVLTPSSYGLQPWKFIVVNNPELRAQLVPHSWGQKQVVDASHLIVFTTKLKLTTDDVKAFIDRTLEVRGGDRKALHAYEEMMIGDVINGPRGAVQKDWMARQVYIALGNLMTTAALLGIDACPMEGIVPEKYDEVLGLKAKGLTTICACPVGYRSAEDGYAHAKKVRFKKDQMIEIL